MRYLYEYAIKKLIILVNLYYTKADLVAQRITNKFDGEIMRCSFEFKETNGVLRGCNAQPHCGHVERDLWPCWWPVPTQVMSIHPHVALQNNTKLQNCEGWFILSLDWQWINQALFLNSYEIFTHCDFSSCDIQSTHNASESAS